MQIALVGSGTIGSALLRQIQRQDAVAKNKVVLVAVSNSRKMLMDNGGIDLSSWKESLDSSGDKADLEKLESYMQTLDGSKIMVDCTASDFVAAKHQQWLQSRLNVVTANKKCMGGSLASFSAVRELAAAQQAQYMCEATVGAGLPVIHTIRGLLETGDEIIQIEGIFSGTLAYLFTNWQLGQKFSEVVAKAKELGFTEPDPRDDLSGMDVARKVVILARLAGGSLELSDLNVDSLVPDDLQGDMSADEFIKKYEQVDDGMAEKVNAAAGRGCVLRYVGKVEVKPEGVVCQVGLQEFPKDHAFASIQGTDNIISFQTRRYYDQKLIIRGPGAGPEVTAAGVFYDILQIGRSQG